MTHKIELLAPAKDLATGIAAIDCGADAVYIGAERFGARKSAGNSVKDIAQLCDYAHKYWARVFVAVNTILRDDELADAVSLTWRLNDAGADALIIQDAGLLECNLPPLPLIASTQMHNATAEKVAFLETVGFSRVILARELSLEQITQIRARTTLELECFVHGALCVCYSGQCYLSYALGGRSGNRGECAQPCRRAYCLTDTHDRVIAESRHVLSLKDLNLCAHLRTLIEAGVSAFKIEGRLKDLDYVKNIVGYYRHALDEVLRGTDLRRSSSGATALGFTPDPRKTFNRGYTTHFFTGTATDIGAVNTPKSIGEPIGAVATVSGDHFTLGGATPLHNGDGICFLDASGGLRGTAVNTVRGAAVYPESMAAIKPGTLIRRNYDRVFCAHLLKCRTTRCIAVTLAVHETPHGFAVTAVDEDGNEARYETRCDKTPAAKPEQAQAQLETQLAKCGGTEFSCAKVEIKTQQAWFIPVAELNALRRGALEALRKARAEHRPAPRVALTPNAAPYPAKTLDYHGNVLNRKAREFYQRHGVTTIAPAAESGLSMRDKTVMTTRYCVRRQFGLCGKDAGASGNAETLLLMDEDGHRLELQFDCAVCEMRVICR